jgi:hypothetical protein
VFSEADHRQPCPAADGVQHVLTKLNCTSRVQIATWAAARGLLDGIMSKHESGSATSTHIYVDVAAPLTDAARHARPGQNDPT